MKVQKQKCYVLMISKTFPTEGGRKMFLKMDLKQFFELESKLNQYAYGLFGVTGWALITDVVRIKPDKDNINFEHRRRENDELVDTITKSFEEVELALS